MSNAGETCSYALLMFFDWRDAGMTDYVAIVKKCEGDIVYTVEGNTSTTVNGNSVRGVWQHQYPIVIIDPEDSICIIELDEKGENYRILWGLVNGGRPTSELPSHLMNHEVKKGVTNGAHRVIYHAHTTNVIALTFVLPLEDKVFTRELWEMATECPVVFPSGIGVVGWMVPGGREIAVATSALMKEYDVAIWAHHGMFCSGEDFDLTFGLMHTVEKSAEILVKMLSMRPDKRQTISPQNFRDLAKDFKVTLPEKFLYDK